MGILLRSKFGNQSFCLQNLLTKVLRFSIAVITRSIFLQMIFKLMTILDQRFCLWQCRIVFTDKTWQWHCTISTMLELGVPWIDPKNHGTTHHQSSRPRIFSHRNPQNRIRCSHNISKTISESNIQVNAFQSMLKNSKASLGLLFEGAWIMIGSFG
jgi:hypothetical protein